jgi:hypothetical protein
MGHSGGPSGEGIETGMIEREGGRPKPRIQPKMNTDTRRHGEKSGYSRRAKYRDDPLDSLEPDLDDDAEESETGDARVDEQDEGEDDADDSGEPGGK